MDLICFVIRNSENQCKTPNVQVNLVNKTWTWTNFPLFLIPGGHCDRSKNSFFCNVLFDKIKIQHLYYHYATTDNQIEHKQLINLLHLLDRNLLLSLGNVLVCFMDHSEIGTQMDTLNFKACTYRVSTLDPGTLDWREGFISDSLIFVMLLLIFKTTIVCKFC